MDNTALIVWHSFLQSAPPGQQKALLSCISPSFLVQLQAQPLPAQSIEQGISPEEKELSHIHYSWLAPYLRSLPEYEIKLFLSALTPVQVKGLKQLLLFTNAIAAPSALGKAYLEKTLYEMVAPEDLVPIDFLPEDPLNILLTLSSSEWNFLIDLLCMHDLSVEIRQIIETSKLKEIYASLTKAQTSFLKTLLHKKEPVTFKKMGLASWKKDKDVLRSMLLQRGINRLAKALYGRHPSLLWHAAHRLDAEKGELLMKLCTSLDHPKASGLLSKQVLELVNAFKTHHTPE